MLITENNLNDLYKLKTKELYTFICKKCGKKTVRQYRPERIKKYKRLLCKDCSISYTWGNKTIEEKDKIVHLAKLTNLKRNGSENYRNVKKFKETWSNKTIEEKLEIQNKVKQTKLDRYGDENYNNLELYRKTMLDRYSVDSAMKCPKIVKKLKETWSNKTIEEKDKIVEKRRKTLEKLGGEEYSRKIYKKISKSHLSRSTDDIEKSNKIRQQTCINKYGVDNVSKVPEYSNKIAYKWKSRNVPAMINKSKQTKLEKYGDPYYTNREKAKKTCRSLYNKDTFLGSDAWKEATKTKHHVRYYYYGIMFDSFWELVVYLYYKDHKINILRSPLGIKYTDTRLNGKNLTYYPDFWIEGIGLVEIKGDQFLDATTGKWVCPYDHSLDNTYEAKHQCAINNNVLIWTKKDIILIQDSVIRKYGNLEQFRFNNPYNPSYWCYYIPYTNNIIKDYYNNSNYIKGYGISPYDIDKDSEYTVCRDSKGISLFDIKPV